MMIKIFNIKHITLISCINCNFNSKIRKNHNKIIIDDEKKTFYHFIRSFLMYEILFIYEFVFSPVVNLKQFQNETFIDFFKQ